MKRIVRLDRVVKDLQLDSHRIPGRFILNAQAMVVGSIGAVGKSGRDIVLLVAIGQTVVGRQSVFKSLFEAEIHPDGVELTTLRRSNQVIHEDGFAVDDSTGANPVDARRVLLLKDDIVDISAIHSTVAGVGNHDGIRLDVFTSQCDSDRVSEGVGFVEDPPVAIVARGFFGVIGDGEIGVEMSPTIATVVLRVERDPILCRVDVVLHIFIQGKDIKRGRQVGPNPWGSLTMEWETSSPPHPHNFEEDKVLQHGPYDYDLVEVEEEES